MALSVVVGAARGLVGMYLSYFVDVSSGANVVLVAAAAFVLAMAYSAVRNRLATVRGALAVASRRSWNRAPLHQHQSAHAVGRELHP